MAVKDHSLDPRIIEAARTEFLEHGFQKASLHSIARQAGITTGALYTRYKNKDDLFCSLIRPTMEEIGRHLAPAAAGYREVQKNPSAAALMAAIRAEEQVYLDLLFTHYDACVLLLCKSAGSSLEAEMNRMIREKSRQTVEFFRSIAGRDIDCRGIELIMSEQFSYYRLMLQRGYSREECISCLKTVDLFLEAGWNAVMNRILSQD